MHRFKIFLEKTISISKKIALILLVYFSVITLFSYFSYKDKPEFKVDPVAKNRERIYSIIRDPKFNSSKEGRLTRDIYRITTCSFIGEACTKNPDDGNKNFEKSIIGQGMNLLMVPYLNPPASGIYWVYSGLNNSGFIPKSYAAEGIGFASIKPLSNVWKSLRNVAFILLVLVLITIGFMIMFRTKINPQTVITMENTIPRIVVSLILITFSFAIAGFLIDLMYIVIALMITILGQAGGLNVSDLQSRYLQAHPNDIFYGLSAKNPFNLFWSFPNSLINLIAPIQVMKNVIGAFFGGIFMFPWLARFFHFLPEAADIEVGAEGGISLGIVAKIQAVLAGFVTALTEAGLGLILLPISIAFGIFVLFPLILGILLFITFLVIALRIFIILFTAYIKVLILIVISPIYLLRELIPGRSAFPAWIRNLTIELLTFPLVIGIFIISLIFFDTASSGELARFPFLYGVDPETLGTVVALWFLFSTPDLVKTVKKAVTPKGLEVAAGPGVFFSGVAAGVGGGAGLFGRYLQYGYYTEHMPERLQTFLSRVPFARSIFKLPGAKK